MLPTRQANCFVRIARDTSDSGQNGEVKTIRKKAIDNDEYDYSNAESKVSKILKRMRLFLILDGPFVGCERIPVRGVTPRTKHVD